MSRIGNILCSLLMATAAAWGAGSRTIMASDNAYVVSGSGDQSEASTLPVKSTTQLAYLRFNIAGLTVQTNDLVYLDLYLTCNSTKDVQQLKVAALNDGVAGETTWNSTLIYANRPDGTSGPLNGNTTAVVTYNGRVMSKDDHTSSRRNQANPPGQIAIVIPNSVFQALLADDTNGELTLILYGAVNSCTVASLGSGNFEPQLRIVRASRVQTIPESIHGGQYVWSSGTAWDDSVTSSHVGKPTTSGLACQFLFFPLPRRPGSGFKADGTSLEIFLKTDDISGWGAAMVDIWAIGYVPAGSVPVGQSDVDTYRLMADVETNAGWNIGSDLTEKIYNNLTSEYSDPGRYGIPPEACSNLTAFVNDLYVSHGAEEGDYLVLRAVADVGPDPRKSYQFYTGNAAANFKPSMTLTAMPRATVLVLQ